MGYPVESSDLETKVTRTCDRALRGSGCTVLSSCSLRPPRSTKQRSVGRWTVRLFDDLVSFDPCRAVVAGCVLAAVLLLALAAHLCHGRTLTASCSARHELRQADNEALVVETIVRGL